jgi:hypothetical protein
LLEVPQGESRLADSSGAKQRHEPLASRIGVRQPRELANATNEA